MIPTSLTRTAFNPSTIGRISSTRRNGCPFLKRTTPHSPSSLSRLTQDLPSSLSMTQNEVNNFFQDATTSIIITSSATTTTTFVGDPTPPGITPIQQFEPVINLPATLSFLTITVIFTLLQIRINAVSSAARRRSQSLEKLRKIESLQLSASDVGIDAKDRPTSEKVAEAKREYEEALRRELDLRTIVPGVRIVAPNDPKRDEEERAAAKRFLGWEGEEFGDDEFEGGEGLSSKRDGGNNGSDGKSSRQSDISEEGMGNGPKSLLIGVAAMLIVLLWTLSFDPMQADKVFTSVGGSPPSDLPFSS
mmetsp:Transcript_23542/g.48230  ORF Transcript_23542/g.48230 Transcript_23542/m.48230 type:complete len:305 (-) Transcript_23542:153-1067(-)|eukprot:CAMPEP_0171342142 /NCGR_PEP_ID=MMETSP0878-20121228/13359_1 /TAXON_ID=67004 /ORGANISM="Thalassiosira weissflogii, Strain CCMP1336" /LENGTH=304 /DNA_ID=CAMNT_0011844707 /DNA_START=31 /DNA_END=945 /DNA_ORIENTATION=-